MGNNVKILFGFTCDVNNEQGNLLIYKNLLTLSHKIDFAYEDRKQCIGLRIKELSSIEDFLEISLSKYNKCDKKWKVIQKEYKKKYKSKLPNGKVLIVMVPSHIIVKSNYLVVHKEPHKQVLTTIDRDDNLINPTCVYCGNAEEYCDGHSLAR